MRVRRLVVPLVALVAACLTAGARVPSESREPLRTLTTTREVHNLPPEQTARAYPVRLRAVVTYYDPYIDTRHGALFVHDAAGCVFVVPVRPVLPLQAGTLVEITGVSGRGDYSPVVLGTGVRVLGQSHLPLKPPNVTLTQLLSGAFDAQWVEIEGRVRSAHLGPNNVVLGIAANDGSLIAVSVRQAGVNYESLVDSLVRIQGNAGAVFNHRDQLLGVRVLFPTLREVQVVQAAPRDPFGVPAVPITELFRYSPDPGLLHRVHVQGKVTLDWPGRMLCIQDPRAGICIQTTQSTGVAVGTLVDVVGFPAVNLFKPTLEDATFRTAGNTSPVPPLAITADQAIKGNLDGQLVQMDAELIGKDLASTDPTLMLRGALCFSGHPSQRRSSRRRAALEGRQPRAHHRRQQCAGGLLEHQFR